MFRHVVQKGCHRSAEYGLSLRGVREQVAPD